MTQPTAAPMISTWTGKGATASWFAAANWKGGVPGAGTRTQFKTGHADAVDLTAAGGTQAQSGGVIVTGDAVTFSGGALTMTPPLPAHGYAIDLSVTGQGSVTIVASASLTGTGEVFIGGDLTVQGRLSDAVGVVDNAVTSGATVSGAAAHWSNTGNLAVAGALLVAAGGTVDGGPDAFTTGFAAIQLGNGIGKAVATVTGAGSLLTATEIDVGTGYSGTLTIAHGAHVVDLIGSAGGNGDGFVTVTGKGSLWQNLNGLSVGQQVPVASTLTVVHGGAVSVGGVLSLPGTLVLDASATLQTAGIVSDGGTIRTLGLGTITISTELDIQGNALAPFEEETTYLASLGGGVLALTGAVKSFDPNAILQIGGGHVVLTNTADLLPAIHVYRGVLELAATGADGGAAILLLGTHGASGTLQIDAGVSAGGWVSGLGGHAAIDFAGIAVSPGMLPGWTQSAGGGTLSVSDGVHSASVALAGTYTAGEFTVSKDGHGGSLVTATGKH